MSARTANDRFHSSQVVGRPSQNVHDCHLQLQTIIGTTTSSPNSFDCHPDIETFTVCAGSAVVVAKVDADLNITQKIFRAKPNVRPINETLSFYNPSTPPATTLRNRLASNSKEGGYGAGHLFEESAGESPGTSQLAKRTREATCISLSSGGTLLAVGEVSSLRSSLCPDQCLAHI